MRQLKPDFMNNLTNNDGKLRKILDFVQADASLSLEIRNDYINIYYRGGNLYKIDNKYEYFTDTGYFIDYTGKNDSLIPTAEKLYKAGKYLEAIPFIKAAMDRYICYKKSYGEKEVQQLTVYENNRSPIANSTHYYIADFEYENMENGSRFDLVAIKWENKRGLKAKLCIIEVKFGYKTIDNSNSSLQSGDKSSDITKHLDDAIKFFSDTEKVETLKIEAITLFNQKQELELISPIGENKVKKLDTLEGTPEFMLWLVNYPPNSTTLSTALNNNKDKILEIKGFDFVIASSSFAGYALFDDKVVKIKDFMGW